MKKIATIMMLAAMAQAIEIPIPGAEGYGKIKYNPAGTGSGISYEMDWKKFINDARAGCLPALPTVDVCGLANNIGSLTGNVCGINGNIDVSSTLKQYCQAGEAKANSVLSNIDVYSVLYGNDDKPLPSGKTKTELDNNIKAETIIKKTESPAYKAYTSGDQRTMKVLLDRLQKDTNLKNKDITQVKATDLKAPANLNEYNEEIKKIAEVAISDVKEASSYKASQQIEKAGSVSSRQKKVQELQQLIDVATAAKIGIAKEALSREGDFAMPTEEGIKYLRDDYRTQAIAKINNQQMREAYIIANIMQEGEARKNLVAIAAEKQAILNEEFDRDLVGTIVDTLINSIF